MAKYVCILHYMLSLSLPSDIRWRFIGSLQSNKLKGLLRVPNLCAIETLDDEDKARRLDALLADRDAPLDVYIQVNTSGEGQKGGLSLQEAPQLARLIVGECAKLRLAGLMTIGSLGHSQLTNDAENPDFVCLVQCRQRVAEALGIAEDKLELSMGMSSDYLQAVRPCSWTQSLSFRSNRDRPACGSALPSSGLAPSGACMLLWMNRCIAKQLATYKDMSVALFYGSLEGKGVIVSCRCSV